MRNKYIHFSLGTGDFCTFTVVCLEAVGVHVGGGGGGLVQNLTRIRFSVVQLHDLKKTKKKNRNNGLLCSNIPS